MNTDFLNSTWVRILPPALIAVAQGLASSELIQEMGAMPQWRTLGLVIPVFWLASIGPKGLEREGGFIMRMFGTKLEGPKAVRLRATLVAFVWLSFGLLAGWGSHGRVEEALKKNAAQIAANRAEKAQANSATSEAELLRKEAAAEPSESIKLTKRALAVSLTLLAGTVEAQATEEEPIEVDYVTCLLYACMHAGIMSCLGVLAFLALRPEST